MLGMENTAREWYNNLSGFDLDGNPIVDPSNGDTTVYSLTGDPVTGSGWYDGPGWDAVDNDGGDRYMAKASGPFDFAPGDSHDIEIAIIMARGDDYLDSVTKLKHKARAVREFYFNGEITSVEESDIIAPSSFVLEQNYPNPFNPSTMINYQLSMIIEVDLGIYNVLGQKVATLVSKKQTAGSYQVEWDARGFASGVYYYVLKAGEFKEVKKMVYIK
jgi:hypothetical protein